MRKQFYEIKQFDKGVSINLHRSMLAVEHDAMLIVIYIWRILEAPWCIVDRDRNDSVILSCRMIDTTCISFILRTKETFWIAACFRIFCCCDRFWIFFRFGKINGNINFAIRAVYFPFLIFLYTIAANIVAVLA